MINREKQLEIGGLTAEQLDEEYGTPLYIYDRETIQSQYRKLEDTFSSRYNNFSIHYAVKANSNPEIVETLVNEGAHLDCAAKAELMLAEELNLNPENVIYTCPYNTKEEIEYAVEMGAVLNLDGIYVLEKVEELPETISFRVDPGIGSGDFGLVFGGGDTKFGVPEERVVEAYRKAIEKGVENFGIHMMTGSNVREEEYFGQITEKLLEIAAEVKQELGVEFEFVDIGGGLGIPYAPDDEPLDLDKTAEIVTEKFKQGIEKHGLGNPELRIEPGRFIVAESGVLLSKVTGIKKKGGKEFVGINTGMHHMIRPMLLNAYHEIAVANDLKRELDSEKTIVGPVCSSTDVMAERELSEIHEGDLIGIMNAGAYGFTMASHWNSRPLPPEIMVENGESRVIREPETEKDIFHGTRMED